MRKLPLALFAGLALLAAAIWSHGENGRYIQVADDSTYVVFDTKTGSTHSMKIVDKELRRFNTNPVR